MRRCGLHSPLLLNGCIVMIGFCVPRRGGGGGVSAGDPWGRTEKYVFFSSCLSSISRGGRFGSGWGCVARERRERTLPATSLCIFLTVARSVVFRCTAGSGHTSSFCRVKVRKALVAGRCALTSIMLWSMISSREPMKKRVLLPTRRQPVTSSFFFFLCPFA